MSSRLEQFIREHRDEFDSGEPARKVWDNIKYELDPSKKKPGSVVRLNYGKWSAAAAVMIFMTGALWFAVRSRITGPTKPSVAVTKSNAPVGSKAKVPQVIVPDKDSKDFVQIDVTPKKGEGIQQGSEEESDYRKEMGLYTKLVEIKHKELRRIEKDEPLLYKKFSGDVKQLDSVYHSLQRQLPKNPNHEQLLEAMIHNLKLQMKLLNQQLEIIKQINHSKKSEYENAYKTL